MGLRNVIRFRFFHWFYYQWKRHFYFNFLIGFLTWLYQGLNLPFSYEIDNTSNFFVLIFILIPFGLAWPILSYSIDFLARYPLRLRVVENEKVAFVVFCTKILFFIHAALVIQGILCYWECINIGMYFDLWIKSLVLIVPIYLLFTLYARNRFFHFSRKRDDFKGKFELKGSGKKSLWLNLDKVIHFKSDDNYVDVIHLDDNGKICTDILRTTLESISKQLAANNEFVRVHRSTIINLRYVKEFAESKILLVGYNELELKINVSITYLPKVKKLLSL